tara:strand:+ start:726 stop:1412 length:687 start_codon:yes stop_codon:yes gene_type:complete
MLPLIIKSANISAKKMSYSIGIDGCKGGWIATSINYNGEVKLDYVEKIGPYLSTQPKEAIILVDMMLDLNNSTSIRPFEACVKKLLGKWHSRCFMAPPKKALETKDYKKACEISFNICGKKISKQCYNLFPKIRELEALRDSRLIEFHPEIAFMLLNKNNVISESKKTIEGIAKRTALIKKVIPGFSSLVKQFASPKVKVDDLLDSTALALVAGNSLYKNFIANLNKV